MATTELARINYAVNTIIEQASSAIGLSKRSAMALAIIAADRDPDLVIRGEQIMTNQGLQDRFVRHKISTEASAKKDSSNAKSELLENGYIRVIGRVSVFAISETGHEMVAEMQAAMDRTIDEMGLKVDERRLLRGLASPPPIGPGSDTESEGAATEKASRSKKKRVTS